MIIVLGWKELHRDVDDLGDVESNSNVQTALNLWPLVMRIIATSSWVLVVLDNKVVNISDHYSNTVDHICSSTCKLSHHLPKADKFDSPEVVVTLSGKVLSFFSVISFEQYLK